MMSSKHRQGGWSFLGLLGFLLVGGVFVSIGFKLIPAYTDHETLKSIMYSTQLDQELMDKGKREIQGGLDKKMNINNMKLPKDYLKITLDKGDVIMDIEYEVRIPIFANVSAVVSFKEQYIGHKR